MMQNNKKNGRPVPDKRLVNNKLFQERWQRNRTQQLHRRFADKSFCERTGWLKTTAYSFSLLINLISVVGAFYGAFWAVKFIGASPALAAIIGLLVLVLLEVAKRFSSDEVWDTYWKDRKLQIGWVSFSFLLFALSVAISGFGIFQGTKDFAPAADLITQDSTLTLLEQQLALANENTATLSGTRNEQGIIFWPAQRAIEGLVQTQNDVLAAINQRQQRIDSDNNKTLEAQALSVGTAAKTALLFYLMLELLFEMCMSFCSHYDFRDFLERIGVSAEVFHSAEFRTSPEFRNLTQDLPQNQLSTNFAHVEVKGFQMRKKGFPPPPPPIAEKRGSTVATTSAGFPKKNTHNPEYVEAGGKKHPKPDALEDVESDLLRICGKWGKVYPKRWNDRVEADGKLHTMATNFTKWYNEMNILLEGDHVGIRSSTMEKVSKYRTAYEKEILPVIRSKKLLL